LPDAEVSKVTSGKSMTALRRVKADVWLAFCPHMEL
jgi:hypothetical protein